MSIQAPEDKDNGQLLATARIFLMLCGQPDDVLEQLSNEFRRLIRNATQRHCVELKHEQLLAIALLILHTNNEGHYPFL